jgi:hypothetical protein
MKVKITESQGHFNIELTPETVLESSQILSMAVNTAPHQKVEVYANFDKQVVGDLYLVKKKRWASHSVKNNMK